MDAESGGSSVVAAAHGRSRTRPRASFVAWPLYLVLGSSVLVAYALLPSPLRSDVVYPALGASAIVAVLAGLRLYRPGHRLGWYLLAGGQLSWVVADVVSGPGRHLASRSRIPLVGGLLHVLAYLAIAVSLSLIVRARGDWRNLGGLLDSAVLTLSIGLLFWVVLGRPAIVVSHESAAYTAVGVASTLALIALGVLTIRLINDPGGWTFSLVLLAGAAILMTVAGRAANTARMAETSQHNVVFDLLWLTCSVALGGAALHPSMRTVYDSASRSKIELTRRRIAILAVATLVAPAALAVELAAGSKVTGWAVVVVTVVLVVLVVVRLSGAIDQIVADSQHREQLQDELAYQVAHDSLTGLPNRARALSLLTAALGRARLSGAIVGLLFVDLDEFKTVNDTFGHAAGDAVLCEIARRMQAQVRSGDAVARLGGDEFLVLLERVDSRSSVVDVATRLVAAASAPITVRGGREVVVGASIGVAISAEGRSDAEHLLLEADAAVYRAKGAGRGRVEIFDDELRRELTERSLLDSAIMSGLQNGEFTLRYQPSVEVATRRVHGYEAIVGWDRPGIGSVPSDEFISVAEASTLICELDTWVLRTALVQLAAWTTVDDVTMTVNISGRHMASARIVADVKHALSLSGILPHRLIVEIAEKDLIDDAAIMTNLRDLRALGVGISVDSFGTAYNLITKLGQLPVDLIKIDPSLLTSPHTISRELFRLIVRAAHEFGLPVIADGVEHVDDLSTLRFTECEFAQGVLFARPMLADEAEKFLTYQAMAVSR